MNETSHGLNCYQSISAELLVALNFQLELDRLKYQVILTPYGMWTLGKGALAANWKLNLTHQNLQKVQGYLKGIKTVKC